MYTPKPHARFLLTLAVLLPALLVLAACEETDDADDSTGDSATPTEQAAETEPADDTGSTPEPTAEPEPTDPPEQDDETPAPTAEPELTATPADEESDDEEASDMSTVRVYLVRNEEIGVAQRTIAGTPEVANGAMLELLTGLTPYEEDIGFSTEVPAETSLLGLNLQEDGTVIVDLSEDFGSGGGSFSMQMRVAQVVFTLTQFDTIDQVEFRVNGQEVDGLGGEGIIIDQPLSRSDFEDLSPAILVESPTPGEEISSPIHLAGTSNVFEATMQIEVIDNSGTVIYEGHATATSGTGERGEFDVEIPVDVTQEGLGTVIVYEASARDGSRTNVVEIPVDLRR